jgi:hypothetical protein
MATKFDGVTVKLGGVEYVIPPLNFRALRTIGPRVAGLGSINRIPTEDDLRLITEIVLAALSRNYPEMTAEMLEDLIDVGNMSVLLQAVMGVSGLDRPKDERAAMESSLGEKLTPRSA